jgi:hypothetical protein
MLKAMPLSVSPNLDFGVEEKGSHTNKHEIKLPTGVAQCNWRNLSEERGYKPVADSGRKGVSSSSDLHWHDFRHVHPRNGSARPREYNGDHE